MKLIAPLLALGLVASTSARWFGDQAPLGSDGRTVQATDELKIPGDNPLKYCNAPDDDILLIEKVDLDPNPPQAGKDLLITASGNFSQKIEDGAYVKLDVKYGLVRLLHTTADLCEQMKEVGKECPLEKGRTAIQKTVQLPKQIPAGKFTVFADVYTKDDEKITCLSAEVTFPRK